LFLFGGGGIAYGVRFTDFLVNEVGLDGEVLRLKSIGKPVDPFDVPKDRSKGKEKEKEEPKVELEAAPAPEAKAEEVEEKKEAEPENDEDLPETLRFKPLPLWTATTTRTLRPIFSDECIAKLYALLVEGKEPPPKVDSGWGSRKARVEVASGNEEAAMNVDGMREEDSANVPAPSRDNGGGRGQGRDRGRGRGGRGGGRGGGRAGDNGQWMNATKDDREVLSQVSGSSPIVETN
jgi:tRNA pseudouridine13 synthase